jgi:uncharacterized protein YndB with AHSA1/START domain
MTKNNFNIEYELKSASINVLWNSIGTALGLAEWFADGVTVNENEYTFTWEQHEQIAYLLSVKTNDSISFQWEEDKDTEYFFELKIVMLPVTGDLALVITDFAEPDDKDDLILLWNKQVEVLRRKTGI